jgi:uncharacterized phage protein (TIGR01671 family)
MREFKFRAWHPESKSMTVFDLEKASKDQYIASHVCALLSNTHLEGKDLMMQFTGLTDKNGVEIYEGDIVRYREPSTPQNQSPEHMVLTIVYEDTSTSFRTSGEWHGEHPIHQDVTIEVIGNEHENPELLKDES